MKTTGFMILLTALFFITACGRGNNNPNENNNENGPVIPGTNQGIPSPFVPGSDGVVDLPVWVNPLNVVRFVPEVRDGLSGIPITWGYNPAMYGYSVVEWHTDTFFRPGDETYFHSLAIHRFLGNHFDVVLRGAFVTEEMIANGNVPDIFLANPRKTRATGLTRTIPEDMIRRYAPNYAALLDVHNGWEVSRAENGEQLALNTFDFYHNDASLFSLYRLEWIERFNFPFPGGNPPIKIAENVYFTPDMYTTSEFMQLMRLFSFEEPNPQRRPGYLPFPSLNEQVRQAAERTWSMAIGFVDHRLDSFVPFLGMFGVNMSIMDEDGVAMPFYASRAYRDAMAFLAEIAENDLYIHPSWNLPDINILDIFVCRYIRLGWVPAEIRDVYWVVNEAQHRDPDRKILITPAISSSQNEGPFNPGGEAWVISAGVNDFTLSRILNMFDAMSFDPEIHAIVTYGFYEQSPYYDEEASKDFMRSVPSDTQTGNLAVMGKSRFVWEGEPFNSPVTFRRGLFFNLLEGAFFTGIIDENVWPRRFFGGFDEIERFARSEEGRSLNLLPHRVDTNNEFTAQWVSLDAMYAHDLYRNYTVRIELGFGPGLEIETGTGYIKHFLLNIFTSNSPEQVQRMGPYNFTRSWDEYMQELNNLGLQEYIDLFSQFPQR
jgi:hypothetical protein